MIRGAPNLDYSAGSCPVCGSSARYWQSKVNDGLTYNISRCSPCGFAFVYPRPSRDWLQNWYANSGHHTSELNVAKDLTVDRVLSREAREPNSTLDAVRIINTIRSISAKKDGLRLLDVGCGYGFFSKEAIRQGFSVTALELARQERAIAQEILGIEPIATSFEDFLSSPEEPFDVVLMSQILEHACDVNFWMDKVHGLLRRGGVVAIALPNFNSFLRYVLKEKEPYITPPAHLNFFTPKSLRRLLEMHGFQVQVTQHVSRIPRSSLEKRLPNLAGLHAFIQTASSALLRIADTADLGMVINAYARKL